MWAEIKLLVSRFVTNYCRNPNQVHTGSGDNVAGHKFVYEGSKERDLDALFDQAWFQGHIENSIKDLGRRYTAELNIELDIAKYFDAISRNDAFCALIDEKLPELLIIVTEARGILINLDFQDHLSKVNSAVASIENQFATLKSDATLSIDVELVLESSNAIRDALSDSQKQISDLGKKEIENLRRRTRIFNEAKRSLYQFDNFIKGRILQLSNCPVALLSGEAGIGKSHLLGDIALNRIKTGKHCILLLGQQFNSENSPWTQILQNLLRVDCNEKELLATLNSKGEAQGERLLFIVDAINEGKGKLFWPEYISGFINEFSNYPWLGLVLSVRSSYERLLIPEELHLNNDLIKISHVGFEGVEYQASRMFFSQYNIEQPSVPLFNTEFSNPLFLRLFCEGLHRSGLTTIPKGYIGLSIIIDFFVKSINQELSKPTLFNYRSDLNIIQRVLDGIVKFKFENNLTYVPYEVAVGIADTILSKFSDKRGFLDALISEGVLSLNNFWKGDEHEEGVYLAYERFGDHLTVSYLLDRELTGDTLESVFRKEGSLYNCINDSYMSQGLIESLSIQVPERTGKELYELLDDESKSSTSIIESFIDSLVWRKPESIKETTRAYVNEYIIPDVELFDKFFQMVYSVSADPDHFYNADRLHKFLMKLSLADRDEIWTTYIHDQDYPESAMCRLIHWTELEEEKSCLSNASRLLMAKALAWLFTSTNTSFRDSATKAEVLLLENNIDVITNLLSEFEGVNDPYVYERIFAAAYGAVLRSGNLDGLNALSIYVVKTIFEVSEVYPNVLVRDYARNIVEYALYKKIISLDDISVIRPPYTSFFPTSFPSNDEVDAYKYDYNSEGFKDYYFGQNAILSSMVTEYGRGRSCYGDFGRYTFQSAMYDWSDELDANDLSNYACKLIFEEYGYDVEKHGRFDRTKDSYSRSASKNERIGKKYQWVALYEVLARLSDNHKMRDDSMGRGEDKQYIWYQGPWNPFVRNIDPTAIPSQGLAPVNESVCEKYLDWGGSNESWLVSDQCLPQPESIISTANPTLDEWLVLEKNLSWKEGVSIELGSSLDSPYKNLWYQIRSYLVKESEAEGLINWLKKKHLMGRWLPESGSCYQVFSREYYWSPAYRFYDNPYYGKHAWEDVCERGDHESVIASVLPTAERYMWESGEASSNQKPYLSPCDDLYTGMQLQYAKSLGEWQNAKGEIVLFDPSVNKEGSSELIVNKNALQEFLKANKVKIIWTCLGEKSIYGTTFSGQKFPQWLELSGVYTLNDGRVEGETRPIVRNSGDY